MKNMDNNVYGVWAIRSGGSIFGHAEAWCKHYGAPIEFDSKDEKRRNMPLNSTKTQRQIAVTASAKSSTSPARSSFHWSVPLTIRYRLPVVRYIFLKTIYSMLS